MRAPPSRRTRTRSCAPPPPQLARPPQVAPPAASPLPSGAPAAAAPILAAFQAAPDAKSRMRLLLDYARRLPPFPEEYKTVEHRVMGCSAQVRPSRGEG